jgi:uncharacterized protein (TIGR02271 family)
MAEMNIQRNARVMASDGAVGRVTHVVVAPETKEVTDLVVDDGDGEQLIPISQVQRVEGDRVMLRGSRTALETAGFRRDQYHEVDEDEVRAATTQTARQGGAPLRDAAEDEVGLGGTREPQPTPEEQRRFADDRAERPGRLQLREERLRVGTEAEEVGAVRLGKRVVEHTETVSVPVTEERVIIERTPGTGEARGGEIRATDETIEVPVMKERVAVDTETVVAEEVDVRKDVTERTERVQDTVRREELVVDGEGDIRTDGENLNAPRTPGYDREQSRRG